MDTPPENPNLSTIPRAARLLGLPERTIYNWVRTMRVRSWRVANSVSLVDLDQVRSLEAQRATSGGLPGWRRRPRTVDRATLLQAAIEWDTVASLHWVSGRFELAAVNAVCAFFAWLVIDPATASNPPAAEPQTPPETSGEGAPP